jgi:hypothetical protein
MKDEERDRALLYLKLRTSFREFVTPSYDVSLNRQIWKGKSGIKGTYLRVVPPLDNRSYRNCINKLYLTTQLTKLLRANES